MPINQLFVKTGTNPRFEHVQQLQWDDNNHLNTATSIQDYTTSPTYPKLRSASLTSLDSTNGVIAFNDDK